MRCPRCGSPGLDGYYGGGYHKVHCPRCPWHGLARTAYRAWDKQMRSAGPTIQTILAQVEQKLSMGDIDTGAAYHYLRQRLTNMFLPE